MAWNLLICAFCTGAAVMFSVWSLICLIKRRRARRPGGAAPRTPHPAPGQNPASEPRRSSRPIPVPQAVRSSTCRQPGSRVSLPPELRFPVCPVHGCRNTGENRRVVIRAGEGEYFCTHCQYRFKPHVKIH